MRPIKRNKAYHSGRWIRIARTMNGIIIRDASQYSCVIPQCIFSRQEKSISR